MIDNLGREMKFRARPLRDEGIGWWMKNGRKMERFRCLSVVELLGEWLLSVKFVLLPSLYNK